MLFARIYATVIDPLLQDVRAFTFAFAGLKAGDRVLDVCCGTGDQALHYAAGKVDAVGVDESSGMIEMAESHRKQRELSNASFCLADAVNLPFKDGSFDCVTISLALHEKTGGAREGVLSEMKRVVKGNGALVFIDFAVPLPRNAYGLGIRAIEFIAGRDHFTCSRDYIRRGGLDGLLTRHGLREEKRQYLKHGTVAIVKAVRDEMA